MKLIARQADVAYLDTHLWLPTLRVGSLDHIRGTLTFEKDRFTLVEAWESAPSHIKVPRNYLSAASRERLPFPVVDSRFKAFPRVELTSEVILDAKHPGQTFQSEASRALLNTYDGILCLRCGAGKTVVALHSAAQLKTPILVVVGDKGLAAQWTKEIRWCLGLKDDDIGKVGDGKFEWKKSVTVAVVNTLAQRSLDGTLPPEMLQHFGVVICDEAHIMAAPYFNAAVPPFQGRRWGLSATPIREDQFDPLLRYTFGDVVYTYLTPDLIPTVYFKKIDTRINLSDPLERAQVEDISGEVHRNKLYGFFARERPDRVATIAKDIADAVAAGRNVIALTHSRDMCEALAAHFPDAGVCHADVKPAERLRRISECNPVIAIMQLGKQALDKPSLDTLMLCEPTTKEGVLQQIMGRILRPSESKKPPIMIVYEDRYIRELFMMCAKIRRKFNKWPSHKGGRIPYKVI